jgi:hypothetical protein
MARGKTPVDVLTPRRVLSLALIAIDTIIEEYTDDPDLADFRRIRPVLATWREGAPARPAEVTWSNPEDVLSN